MLQKELELHPDWTPTTETKIRRTLNEIKDREVAPSNCDKILRCALWHESPTGMAHTSKDDSLHQKAKAIKQDMQTEAYTLNHQAPAISFDAHRCTELGTKHCRKRAHRDVMTHGCFLSMSASRYTDGQHAARGKLQFLEDRTEVDTWSTKTTGTDKAKAHQRLIAIHNAMADTKWLATFKQMHEDWDKLHENARKRDFLFPTPNRDKRLLPHTMSQQEIPQIPSTGAGRDARTLQLEARIVSWAVRGCPMPIFNQRGYLLL